WFRFNRIRRGRNRYLRAREAYGQGRLLSVALNLSIAAILAPEVAFFMGVYPRLKNSAHGILESMLNRLASRRSTYLQTAVFFDRRDVWTDGWVGPKLTASRDVAAGVDNLTLRGDVDLTFMTKPFVLTVSIDGLQIERTRLR